MPVDDSRNGAADFHSFSRVESARWYALLQLFLPVEHHLNLRGGRSTLCHACRDETDETFAVRREVVISRNVWRTLASWSMHWRWRIEREARLGRDVDGRELNNAGNVRQLLPVLCPRCMVPVAFLRQLIPRSGRRERLHEHGAELADDAPARVRHPSAVGRKRGVRDRRRLDAANGAVLRSLTESSINTTLAPLVSENSSHWPLGDHDSGKSEAPC